MSWAKLSDDFADDCEILSDAAFRLHVEALCWNGRKLLDCKIPKRQLVKFASHPEAVGELIQRTYWGEDAEHYILRHHATYQRSRQAVLTQQAANKANGRKGGRPKVQRERADELLQSESETELVSEPLTERDGTGQDRNGLLGEVPIDERQSISEAWTDRGEPFDQNRLRRWAAQTK